MTNIVQILKKMIERNITEDFFLSKSKTLPFMHFGMTKTMQAKLNTNETHFCLFQ